MMFFGLPAFEATTKLTTIKLQLEVVTTDMCRLFHADYYRQRLCVRTEALERSGLIIRTRIVMLSEKGTTTTS